MPHAFVTVLQPDPLLHPDRLVCAPCEAPVPLTKAGSVKQGTRYCSTGCRISAVRDRRAQARADLVDALDQLRAVKAA